MRDYVSIGSSPSDQDCVQVGSEDYNHLARKECLRFIDVIRKKCGKEVGSARLSIMSNAHDFGSYLDVVCYYDDQDEAGAEYAYMVEANAPTTWKDTEPVVQSHKGV